MIPPFADQFVHALAAYAPRHAQAVREIDEAWKRFGQALIAQQLAARAAVPPDGDGTADTQLDGAA
jgi:hypothetical protein